MEELILENNNIDIMKINKVHFIGIGGISMSALAEILISKGKKVTGSDWNRSEITNKLEGMGVKVFYQQVRENISEDIDLVVYTAAISDDNEELMEVRKRNIPVMVRADFLGLLMKEYSKAIGISGTHGKTTTTSMAAHILMEGETDPTILVGGILDSIAGNLKIGSSEYFLTEACEYTNSFLSFFPTTAVILNVCEDHMDFFNNIDEIRESFKNYAQLVPEDGNVILNCEIPDIEYFTRDLKCNVVTFGKSESNGDVCCKNVHYYDDSTCSYSLVLKGKEMGQIHLNVTGIHNIFNSLAAASVGMVMGLTFEKIKTGLESFRGTERRFEYKGNFNGVRVVDDYAHHPDEIRATLTAARESGEKNIWCVFQPHTYTRTKAFLNGFAETLSLADHIVLADIYAAREKDNGEVSSADIVKLLKEMGKDVNYFHSFEEIEKFIKEKCINGDLLITMGAGNVVNIGNDLLK